jgi:hypothetical protein
MKFTLFSSYFLFAGFFLHSPLAQHTHKKILRWRLFIVLVPIGKTTRCCNSVEVFRGNFEISRGFNTRTVRTLGKSPDHKVTTLRGFKSSSKHRWFTVGGPLITGSETVHDENMNRKIDWSTWAHTGIKKPEKKMQSEAGVLDEPDSAKPAQRSSHTGPPGYIGWKRFQPM